MWRHWSAGCYFVCRWIERQEQFWEDHDGRHGEKRAEEQRPGDGVSRIERQWCRRHCRPGLCPRPRLCVFRKRTVFQRERHTSQRLYRGRSEYLYRMPGAQHGHRTGRNQHNLCCSQHRRALPNKRCHSGPATRDLSRGRTGGLARRSRCMAGPVLVAGHPEQPGDVPDLRVHAPAGRCEPRHDRLDLLPQRLHLFLRGRVHRPHLRQVRPALAGTGRHGVPCRWPCAVEFLHEYVPDPFRYHVADYPPGGLC